MLAESFLTPADLKMSRKVHAAHIAVLRMLERREVIHVADPHVDGGALFGPGAIVPMNRGFHMAVVCADSWCGTTCCIGGWVMVVASNKLDSAKRTFFCLDTLITSKAQRSLYYPPEEYEMHKIGVQEAAQALRNFLTHGEPRWKEVLTNEHFTPIAKFLNEHHFGKVAA